MTDITTSARTADTSVPILDVLSDRWSPRAFDATATIDEQTLTAALEAARWSPSAANTQPWRFIIGRRGSATFNTIAASLMGFNKAWAGNAGALIVAVAEVTDADGKPLPWAIYDLGQSMAHLSIQAHHDGLHVHQMGGFKKDELAEAFDLGPNHQILTVSAIGHMASPDTLEDKLREREVAPRERKALDEIVLVND
jgi:nitroreductase